jgi:hypothetical protein
MAAVQAIFNKNQDLSWFFRFCVASLSKRMNGIYFPKSGALALLLVLSCPEDPKTFPSLAHDTCMHTTYYWWKPHALRHEIIAAQRREIVIVTTQTVDIGKKFSGLQVYIMAKLHLINVRIQTVCGPGRQLWPDIRANNHTVTVTVTVTLPDHDIPFARALDYGK